MRIGVSAWRLFGQRLGIGRYIEYMLKHWSTMLAPHDQVDVFVHEPFDRDALQLSSSFSTHVVRPKLTNAVWENLLLPRAARGCDVLFGPSYTLPLAYRGRSVVVIHSVDEAEPGAHSWWHHLTFSQKYRLSALRADTVIVNAHTAKQRAQEYYGVPPEKLEVIWLGADAAFRPLNDPELARATRTRYFGRDRPYILFAGGMSKRRNVPMLLEAFSEVLRREHIPHGLLFVGPNRAGLPFRELAERFGIADSVVQTDGIFARHEEMVPIYNAADAFVLPSSSEGFSLTMAEAMACGLPVVTVNRAALGEVAHGFALTLEQPEVGALADAIYQVITDTALAERLRQRSLERSRDLRWEVTARRTLAVLRQVAAR
jgi:glycosyltransferase involved in cell wall biosynthesis